MASTEGSLDPLELARLRTQVKELRDQLEVRSRSEDETRLLTKLVFDVSIALADRGSLQEMLTVCCQTLVQQLGAAFARIWTLRPTEHILELQASAGLYTHLDGPHSRIQVGEYKIGRIAASGQPHLTNDVQNDPEVSDRNWAKREDMIAFAGHPLLIGDRLLGVLAVFSRSAFDETTLQVLETVASLTAHGIDREWLKEKTEIALRASERSNEALQRFAAIASHDLQEPLRQVTAFSEMLSQLYQDKLDAEAQEYLAFIVDGGARMGRLIQGLLSYAQIEALESTPSQNANADDALSEALQGLGLLITESRAEISRDPLPEVHGNQTQLAQLFHNIVGNALKYHSDEEPRVHVSAVRQGEEWIFSVSDNGQGIAPEYRTKIFGVFIRLHGRDISGAGLGLAFCSKIVELHRGRIWVEANPSVRTGSIFRFSIPA